MENFPPPEELKTVFVEHDLQAEEDDFPVLDFIANDVKVKECADRETVEKTLRSVGFDNDRISQAVGPFLAGFWKMKLELARAMILNLDIMLLDEPANHLDVANVAWLHSYLASLKHVTSMIVSHDSGFFDRMKPEAAAYYNLDASLIKFKFPEPGFLEGEVSKDKAIKMSKCSLNSRIAIVGPNGAGRSTVIKCLTGEVGPRTVASKSIPTFVSRRLPGTPSTTSSSIRQTANDYIRWRYAYGEDCELAQKQTLTEDIVGSPKETTSYEYKIKWVGKSWDDNLWMTREKLKRGRKGRMYIRPLTQKNVEIQLEDCGLPAEFGSHSRMRGLSGGQKVKVVLAAAMWFNPQMLIMDEPTNFLDHDSLGALAGAIKDYGGGVILITHNHAFAKHICQEQRFEEKTMVDAFGNVEEVESTKKLTRKEKMLKNKKIADLDDDEEL
ncbi:translational elongation factor EF-1 alpha [Irineochytrium annulatum]|nr:translational elongation factor EF-1 alpha [Irineochytrium annulatum]